MKRVYFLLMVIILTSIVFLSCSNDDEENHAPSCSITSPPNNSIYAIGDSIKILVDANDSDGYIVDILFYMNDDPVGSDNVFPYKYAFSTTDLVAGNYSITAIAKDNDGAETEKILNFGVAPNAPINLQINQISITSAEIKWKNYSSGEEKFEIERKLSSETTEFFAKLGEVIRTDSINYSWVDMTLLPNLTYDYRVRGVNGTNYSEYITESYLNYFPEPSLLTYQNDAIDRIKLTWVDNSIGEDGFKIDKKNGEEEWINGYAILVENVETWTDVNAEINQFLKYRIYAYKDSVTSSLFETPEPIDNTFPAPTDLIITQTSVTSAELSWKDNSIGEDKFEIERKLSTETTFVKIAEVIGDDTETKNWSESSLTINLTYDYRVKAVKNIHSSTYFEKRGYETFAAPSKLTPAVLNETSIKLTWIDNIVGEDGYKIDKKIGADGTWLTDYVILGSDAHTWTDTGLIEGVYYFYKVRSYYSISHSEYSNEVNSKPFELTELIYIPAGSFIMGYLYDTHHTVTISKDFYMSKFEVTQKEWTDIMGSNPSVDHGVGLNFPVYNTNWYSSLVYCNIRSIAEGLTPCYTISGTTDPNQWGSIPIVSNSIWDAVECNWSVNGYRLATEAEWEYVAQYNNSRTYPWGETTPSSTLCNYNNNVGASTEVGSYPAGNSKLGLSDMGGNVAEWVWDWFDYYSTSSQIDPTGPSSGTQRILRSIWWSFSDPSGLRCVLRSRTTPISATYMNGLRIVRLP